MSSCGKIVVQKGEVLYFIFPSENACVYKFSPPKTKKKWIQAYLIPPS